MKERKIDTFLMTPNNESSFQSPTTSSSLSAFSSKNNQNNSQSPATNMNDSKLYKAAYDKETKTFISALRQEAESTTSRSFNFKSLNDLRKSIEKNTSKPMHDILQSMNFVGFVSRELALIQHHTSLFLTNTGRLSEELFYQLALFNFGNFGYYQLTEPILIADLASMALDNPDSEWYFFELFYFFAVSFLDF